MSSPRPSPHFREPRNEPPVLIVGGGPAGLSAAHALAAAGQRVVLVEKADRLGGAPILSGYAKLVPTGEWAKDAIGGMVKRIESNKLVDVRKNATVKSFVGGPGDFHATLSDGTQVEAGAAILCTGFTHFDFDQQAGMGLRHLSRRGHYHAGRADVLFRQGRALSVRWARAAAGCHSPLRRLARPPDRPRMVLENLLHRLLEPGDGDPRGAAEMQRLHLLHGYPHLRAYEDLYYWESQEKYKVKYIKARIAEVTSDGKRLIVKGEDTLVKRPITIPFDMVVHAIGMDPNVDNMTLSAVFDVKLEKHGHIQKASTYSNMSATSRPGVFVAGAATGPETIDDFIAQGQSAAMAALTLVRSALLEAAE